MKYLILSDIHSNLHALEAFLETASQKGYDSLVCLGDIVGYGAFPDECISIIKEKADIALLGNHDSAATGGDIRNFNPYAKAAAQWTRKHISRAGKSYLKKLPYSHIIEKSEFVHASPDNPSAWRYIMSIYNAGDAFRTTGSDRIFIGHTHIPAVYEKAGDEVKMSFPDKSILSADVRYIINAGSVGQPRNSDNRACGILYDSDADEAEYIRVEYDIDSASKAILDAGLPEFLAQRLARGL